MARSAQRPARWLTVYGLMIFRRDSSIEASKLNDDLLDAIRVALHQQDLSP